MPWQSHPGGLIYELAVCPFDTDHTGGSAAFTVVDGEPGFRCQHNGCYGKTIKDVFAQYPSDWRKTAGLNGDKASGGGGDPRPGYVASDKYGIGTDRPGDIPISATAQWPAPIDEAVFYGLTGDIVRMLEPQTEADPVALLIHVLLGMGNLWGRGPHFRVGGARHYANENAICVGKTSSARKGTAKSDTFNLLSPVDSRWAENHVMAGLSSGEGLIWAVKDEIEKQEPIRGKNKTIIGYQTVVTDKGMADKRLLVIEPEFASVLRVAGRVGSTLSTVYRQAWDSGVLRVLNKNSPVKATGTHISIIGHITRDELLMELSNNDKVNGFGNRNLWLCVQRSKFLPGGGDWDHLDLGPLVSRLGMSSSSPARWARCAGIPKRAPCGTRFTSS